MYISLNWIKEYVDIPKDITPQRLGELLTMHSVEVEAVTEQGQYLNQVVVGEILEIRKHPDANKLNISKVDVGEKKSRQIIFGQMMAMKVGYKVPVALAPAVLIGNKKIDKVKLRGELSEGMLCLDQEIGLAKDGVSTHFFEKNIKNGTPIIKALNLDDVIIDIDNKTITNRPDLWSHFGIAREISAIVSKPIKSIKSIKSKVHKVKSQLEIEIKDKKFCPRYMGVVIDNIKVESSPDWMQARLSSVGVRPINNIVDITNYVMLELGQPMHAFDFEKLENSNNKTKIIVRKAKTGEKIKTLDGTKRELDKNILVIADTKKPIAIAGVMGGTNSEVDNNTTKIVLESANFEAINNRQTSTKLGLRTEAVMRYEKRLDPHLVEIAINRVLQLISEIIPKAVVSSDIQDNNVGAQDFEPLRTITLSTNYVQKKIGVEICVDQIGNILESLGFEIQELKSSNNDDIIFSVQVPSWRATNDVSMADDLVEEVARIYGFNNIKPVMPLVEMIPPKVNQHRKLEREVKNSLNSLGFDEVYNYAFTSEDRVQKTGGKIDEHIRLLNNLSSEYALLRKSLKENLINNVKDNLRYFDKFKIFEIGSVFDKKDGKVLAHPDAKTKLPKQTKIVSGVIVCECTASDVFLKAKEAVENLLKNIGINDYLILPSRGKADAEIVVHNKKIGKIYILSKNIQSNFDINPKINCGIFELDFDELFSLPKKEIKYIKLSKFPEVKIDLSIIAPKDILWHNIDKEIRSAVGSKLKHIELFDIYEGKGVDDDKKSLAMHLSFGEEGRTMEMSEVEKMRDKIVERLKKKFDADIRV